MLQAPQQLRLTFYRKVLAAQVNGNMPLAVFPQSLATFFAIPTNLFGCKVFGARLAAPAQCSFATP